MKESQEWWSIFTVPAKQCLDENHALHSHTTEIQVESGTYQSPQQCLFNGISPIKLRRGVDEKVLTDLYGFVRT